MQLAQAARDETDMGLCGVQRATAKVAGQTDAIDDVACRAAPCQQCRQRGARDRMHHLFLAFEPGDQGCTDEAAGTENGEG